MKVKDITTTLGGLIDQANKQANNNPYTGQSNPLNPGPVYGSPEDSIPDELQDEPIFEIDYKSEQEQCIDKARKSIMIVVREVVPETLQETSLIQDKIDQDAEQLGNLYYQYVKKETYHQAMMDLIARGNHNVKMFEVCEKISRSLEDLGTKITELQNQFRKYYIDTYKDMQYKEQEDEYIAENGGSTVHAGLPSSQHNKTEVITSADNVKSLSNRIVGTEAVSKILSEQKKEKLKAMAMAETTEPIQ
jgi:hypothetical protein